MSNELKPTTHHSSLITHHSNELFRALDVASFAGVNANAVAFVDEGRDCDGDAVFERRGLVDVGDGRAFERRLGAGDGEFQRGWQSDAKRSALVKLYLDFQPRY